jgi:hypothetical protein
MAGLRGIHNRHGDELARLLDPAHARETGLKVRAEIVNTRFSGTSARWLDGYFQAERDKLERAIKVIGEVRSLMAEAKRKFAAEYGVTSETLAEFATERFLVELARLEEHCDRDFKSTTSLLTRGRKTLAALFFDTVATQVIRVFEIADREVRTWMNGFIRPLEAQLSAFQEQTNARIEGMGRIQNAETDLVARLDELQALLAEGRGPARPMRGAARAALGAPRSEPRALARLSYCSAFFSSSARYLASSSSRVSTWSGSSGMQSTGQTSRHWGASKWPTHSVHRDASIT